MEEILKQIDKEIQVCESASQVLRNQLQAAISIDEISRVGRMLSESNGEIKAYLKSKEFILNSIK